MVDKSKDFSGESFSKEERINSKKTIEELFKKGSSSHSYPYLLKYLPANSSDCHQVLISVSKKHFKKAVDRNLLKRRMREAYRKNKSLLYPSSKKFYIAIIYIGKEINPYQLMEHKLIKLMKRLPKNLD